MSERGVRPRIITFMLSFVALEDVPDSLGGRRETVAIHNTL